jgi:acetate kinase
MSSPDAGRIAVINAGSSSIKFAIYGAEADGPALFKGQIEQIGVSPRLKAVDASGSPVAEGSWRAGDLDQPAAVREVLIQAAALNRGAPIAAIGHRVVHGGMKYARPVRVDAGVLDYLHTLDALAPLHQPHNLAAIETIIEAAPDIPQVACFDTAFHHGQPRLAQLFGLPRHFADEGVRRYGFHGLSYEYVSGRLTALAPRLAAGRVVIAHLGNGASLCALQGGRSVACTLGFTALDGLIMGSRCGSLDPGVVLHLMDVHGLDARGVEDLLYRRSGLLGVSGVSSDMRELRASTDPAAAEAVALFVYRIVREVGSCAAAMGGLDGLVFTGGIGQNDVRTRAEVVAGCRWLGLDLDEEANAQGGEARINAAGSLVSVWVTPTDEERMVARHTQQALDGR